ncbi:MAG: protein kinase domain-containing protein [Candidatus Sericytochromatia bacterium]
MLEPGHRLWDRYRLETELGRGGMGVVYRAWDERDQRPVAVKALLLDSVPPAEREETLARFEREARTSMTLRHPHIVQVYDLIGEGGQWFLIMEYLDGQTLKAFLDGQMPLSGAELLKLLVQICDGLSYAHQQDIVHRDIKPDNLFVTRERQAKIMDFGIARQNNAEHFLLNTQPGTMLGTLSYMSPEQLQDSANVDGRCDIYALGVVMYELFTGQLPFAAASMGQTVLQIISSDAAPVREHNPNLPEALENLIARAMCKRRGQRYQSAQDLASDLLKLGAQPAAGVTGSTSRQDTGPQWQRQTLRTQSGKDNQQTRPAMGRIEDQLAAEGLSLDTEPPQSLQDRDCGLLLECEVGGQRAWLSCDPTYALQPPTRARIQDLLTRAGICHGIQDTVLSQLESQGFLHRSLIAQGEAALPGQPAQLQVLFSEGRQGPAERQDGSVDHRELELHRSVAAGTPLLRREPPVPGQAGTNIYGRSVPPLPVADIKLLEGPGTALAADDPCLLLATLDGMPVRMAQSVRIEQALELPEVGVTTGHIRFDGTVVVRGTVHKGYFIEAGGDIVVHGPVEDCSLQAGGNLYLYGPVYGGSNTLLRSRYQIQATFVQQARIECGSDLLVSEGLLHCQTRVTGRALLGGPVGEHTGRGVVNGGQLYSSYCIELRSAGAAASTATLLAVGTHPQLEAQLSDLEAQQAVNRRQLQENIKGMIYLRTQGGADPERLQALEKHRGQLLFAGNTLTDEIQFLKDSLRQASQPRSCRIRVLDTLCPGVRVNISGCGRSFEEETAGPLTLYVPASDRRQREVALTYG